MAKAERIVRVGQRWRNVYVGFPQDKTRSARDDLEVVEITVTVHGRCCVTAKRADGTQVLLDPQHFQTGVLEE